MNDDLSGRATKFGGSLARHGWIGNVGTRGRQSLEDQECWLKTMVSCKWKRRRRLDGAIGQYSAFAVTSFDGFVKVFFE